MRCPPPPPHWRRGDVVILKSSNRWLWFISRCLWSRRTMLGWSPAAKKNLYLHLIILILCWHINNDYKWRNMEGWTRIIWKPDCENMIKREWRDPVWREKGERSQEFLNRAPKDTVTLPSSPTNGSLAVDSQDIMGLCLLVWYKKTWTKLQPQTPHVDKECNIVG